MWIGASAGALTLLCTIFGFLVKDTILQELGVPRSVFEPTSTEYVVSGAKFLGSVVPLALYGAGQFIVACWWMVLALGLFALVLLVARRWRWSAELRLFGVAALYGAWLVVMLLRLTERPPGDYQGLNVLAFGTLVGLIYCYIETYLSAGGSGVGTVLRWGARLPIYALVFCSAFTLPYMKAVHGTISIYPLVEFLSRDRDSFCALVTAGPPDEGPQDNCAVFELIEQGRDRVLLRRPPGARIYVVPVASMNTFALLPPEKRR